MANVFTSLSNALWYTDKCSICTGSTAVTYQVYATALGAAPAAGNIYSGPPEIGANEIKQIYVGVGNYLTVSGSNYTAQEIGGQTSAQAGTGNFAENLTPPPVTNGSLLVPDTSSRIDLSPGIVLGATPPLGSVLLNATPTQWLSIPNNSAFSQDTAFTYEGWFYPTSLTTCYPFIMLQQNWIGVSYANNGKFALDMSYVGNPPGYSTLATTYPINNWYHIALTWTGSAGKLFINGAQESVFTGAGATVSDGNPLYIGQYQDQAFASFQGNVSNFRVVKGTAVYTVPFTPPTAPLTAISGTQLLLNTPNDANFLVDSSTNNFTVTNNGAITSVATTPFTTPFTVEGWFYSTVNPGTDSGPVLLSTTTSSGTAAYAKALTVNVSSSTQVVVDSNGAAATAFDFAETMLVDTWYYLAVTRDTSGYIQVWLGKDGDAAATASTTGRFDTSDNTNWALSGLSDCIGTFVPANRFTTGYISNLRVDNTSLYTTTDATIPVPTAPFAEIAGTVFLQNDATLTDQTGNQTLTAVGTAAGDVLNPFT